MQEEAPGRAANQKHRSVLKHMRYDKDSGHFMSTEGYKVDHDNHRTLQEMLNNANGVSEGMVQALPTTAVDKESVADTGPL